MKARSAYSLTEILVVMAILSVVLAVGYRSLSFFTKEAAQISHAAVSQRKAEYDRFIGVLNDRLAQAWTFTVSNASYSGLDGQQLNLYDHQNAHFARLGIYTNDTVFIFHLEDLVAVTWAQNLLYAFTNRSATSEYALHLHTNVADHGSVTASWKVPPPFYPEADNEAFKSLFLHKDAADLAFQVEEHRAKSSGLFQHDLRSYSFNPKQQAFR